MQFTSLEFLILISFELEKKMQNSFSIFFQPIIKRNKDSKFDEKFNIQHKFKPFKYDMISATIASKR